MYILPQLYKCPKCKMEINYSPHDNWGIPVIERKPTCPYCYAEFIKKNVPLMELKD